MKKRLLLFTISFLGLVTAQAQDTPGEKYDHVMASHPIRFGIKAGLNASNINIDNEGTLNNKKAMAGWQAGFYVDIPLLPIVSLQPGIFLNSKGAKFTMGNNEGNNYTEVSTKPLYLEVPINVIVKIPLPNKVKLFAGAGPYTAIGIGGKNKMEGKLLGASFSTNDPIEYGNDDAQPTTNVYNGDLKRLDLGLNFIAGLEISHLMLNANYGYGLVNIKSNAENNNAKYQNRVFSLAIGVLF